MIKEIITNNNTYLFVEVPLDAYDFKLYITKQGQVIKLITGYLRLTYQKVNLKYTVPAHFQIMTLILKLPIKWHLVIHHAVKVIITKAVNVIKMDATEKIKMECLLIKSKRH